MNYFLSIPLSHYLALSIHVSLSLYIYRYIQIHVLHMWHYASECYCYYLGQYVVCLLVACIHLHVYVHVYVYVYHQVINTPVLCISSRYASRKPMLTERPPRQPVCSAASKIQVHAFCARGGACCVREHPGRQKAILDFPSPSPSLQKTRTNQLPNCP